MIQGSLSRRYAKALFQLAQESRKEESIAEELDRFDRSYRESPLAAVLNNPAFDMQMRKKVVADVGRALQLSQLVIHFLTLLLERHRLEFLSSIVTFYHRLLDETLGRVKARLVAATELDQTLKSSLQQTLERISGKQVICQTETDPALLGGVIIEMEGKAYDGSVRTQIQRMKEMIARGAWGGKLWR